MLLKSFFTLAVIALLLSPSSSLLLKKKKHPHFLKKHLFKKLPLPLPLSLPKLPGFPHFNFPSIFADASPHQALEFEYPVEHVPVHLQAVPVQHEVEEYTAPEEPLLKTADYLALFEALRHTASSFNPIKLLQAKPAPPKPVVVPSYKFVPSLGFSHYNKVNYIPIQPHFVASQTFVPQTFVPQPHVPQSYAPPPYVPQAPAPQPHVPQIYIPQPVAPPHFPESVPLFPPEGPSVVQPPQPFFPPTPEVSVPAPYPHSA